MVLNFTSGHGKRLTLLVDLDLRLEVRDFRGPHGELLRRFLVLPIDTILPASPATSLSAAEGNCFSEASFL